MGQHTSTLIQTSSIISILLKVGTAAPIDGNVTVADLGDERSEFFASAVGTALIMFVMVLYIVMCIKKIMNAGAYAKTTISDQTTESPTIPDKQRPHVANPSVESTLPLSKDGPPRSPTTLDFDTRVPLVVLPNGTNVLIRSEADAPKDSPCCADSGNE